MIACSGVSLLSMTSVFRQDGGGPYPGGARYNSYGAYLREKFGERVSKVVVDAGFTCPNRDGTAGVGGCTYCNNDAFRPQSASRLKPIPLQVEEGISFLKRRYRVRKFIVYFQPFSNTHAPLGQLIPLYESALCRPDVIGLAVGTRPDCVDEEKIAWFAQLSQKRFVVIEYGLESTHDRTLGLINRGHDYARWLRAMELSRGRGIHLSAHLILGFPWETREEMLSMAADVSGVGLDFLKLHHLHVVRGTAMARQFMSDPFPLLGYEEYRDLLVEFLELLNPVIRLERFFGISPDEILLAPRWGKTRTEMQRDVEQDLARRETWQGRRYSGPS